ncbi:MAG: DUF1353 domain-containing protein [Gammaproteobacteria bacterium]|nr:hypothetical protein [Chromatiales bacterium]MCP4926291.1 DUF1353 domain-containing protein [Gammaproteobacteria bacterium]
MGFIRYRSDYKYQLAEGYEISTLIRPGVDINTDYINLDVAGKLLVKKSYAWDGPSGLVKDTQKNMRASLVHDALYQLMRNKHLSARTWRKAADIQFMELCKQDGVSNRTANLWYRGLRRYGKPAASPENKKKVARAPPVDE